MATSPATYTGDMVERDARTRWSHPIATLVTAVALRVVLVALYLAFSRWLLHTDVHFYYDFARRSDLGEYPFVHFWMEYPPLFPFLAVGLYQALGAVHLAGAGYFYLGHALLMSVVDVANLLLVHSLVRLAHGERRAGYAALVYAGLPLPIWYSIGWFDALAVLALLAGLLAVLKQSPVSAGILAGLGAMTKLFPLVLVLVALAALARRAALRMALIACGAIAAVLAPLALVRADLLLATFGVMLGRQPWETLWALLIGKYSYGMLPPIEERFTSATASVDSTSPLGLAPLLVQVGLGLVAVWAAVALAAANRARPRDTYVLTALGVTLLLLGSKGFSPQFVVWLVPLILLVWPNRIGLAYVLGLTIYVALSYQGQSDTIEGHALAAAVGPRLYLWLVILWRTLILALLAIHLIRSVQSRLESSRSYRLPAELVRR